MIKFTQVFLLFTLFYLMPTTDTLAKNREILLGPVPATVIKVIDGDTVDVKAKIWIGQEITIRVRLRDIDTPEITGRCDDESMIALEAKNFVENELKNHTVLLTNIQQGKYAGRVIANIATKTGQDLSQELLKVGLARPYRPRRFHSWCNTNY